MSNPLVAWLVVSQASPNPQGANTMQNEHLASGVWPTLSGFRIRTTTINRVTKSSTRVRTWAIPSSLRLTTSDLADDPPATGIFQERPRVLTETKQADFQQSNKKRSFRLLASAKRNRSDLNLNIFHTLLPRTVPPLAPAS